MHPLTLARPGHCCPGSLLLMVRREKKRRRQVLGRGPCIVPLPTHPDAFPVPFSPKGVRPGVQRTSRFATTQRPRFRCRRRLIRKSLFVCPVPEPLLPFLELTSRSDLLRLQRPCTRPRPETPDGKLIFASRAIRRKENRPGRRNFLGINRWIYWGNGCGQVEKPIRRKALGGENSLKHPKRKIRQGGVDSALRPGISPTHPGCLRLAATLPIRQLECWRPTNGWPERREPAACLPPSAINVSTWTATELSTHSPIFKASMNASCGMSTFPN